MVTAALQHANMSCASILRCVSDTFPTSHRTNRLQVHPGIPAAPPAGTHAAGLLHLDSEVQCVRGWPEQ